MLYDILNVYETYSFIYEFDSYGIYIWDADCRRELLTVITFELTFESWYPQQLLRPSSC